MQQSDATRLLPPPSNAPQHRSFRHPLLPRPFPLSPILSSSVSSPAMAWLQSNRRVQIPTQPRAQARPILDEDERIANGDEVAESLNLKSTDRNVTEDKNRDPFMGVKVRRKASFHRDYIGDYLDVPSQPYLLKILEKQASDEWLHGFCLASLDFYAITVAVSFSCEADTVIIADSSAFYSFQHLGGIDYACDKKILFADKVLKFTSSGKMKRRIFLMTDFAIYIVDPDIDALKRRISLAAVEKLCLSELSDNFLAIIIPTEYDLLMASTRKTEIVTVLVDATKSQSDYELEVLLSNRFEYNATSELVKEIDFEETEGGVRTRIVRK